MLKLYSLQRLFFSLLCCGLLLSLIGCQNASGKERGIAGDRPTDVVGALLDRYRADEDFMELCSPKLDEIAVREVMDKMIDPDWQYFISEENPEEFGVSVGENQYMVLFSGGEAEETDDGTIIDGSNEAYAIVTTDTKTNNYVISGLFKLSRFDN